MTAYLMVRAEVPEADRVGFDRWYEHDHLPDAKATFGCRSAARGWSAVTPGVHVAFYEFADAQKAQAAVSSAGMDRLIADFTRAWPNVARTREIVGFSQRI